MANAAHPAPRALPGTAGALNALAGVGRFIRLMARNKVGFAGFLGVIFFLILSFIVPIFVPIDTATVTGSIYAAPSWAHPLGTDYEGRDIWVQIIHGGADVIIVGFLTAAITTVIAVSLGALTAFVGGRFDELMMGLTDIVLTIPQFPLLAVLAAFISLNNAVLVALLLSALGWPLLLRSVRAQVLSLKEREYVEAARGLDLGTGHILFREILPNMMSYVTISFTLAATSAVYTEVGLIFLGLVPLSGSNWGLMMNLAYSRGAVFYPPSMFYILGPVIAVALFQLSLVFMTRSLEVVFNPRLQGWGTGSPFPQFSFFQDLEYPNPPVAAGPGMGFNLTQNGVNLVNLITATGAGFSLENQRVAVAQMARTFNDLLPIIPLFERYGNNVALQGVRVTGWPADSDPIYQNDFYSDSFVTMMIVSGQLKGV